MALSDIENHKTLGIDVDKLYPVSTIRRVVGKGQGQEFDPEKPLKSPKKPQKDPQHESAEPEDWVTLNQGLPTDNSDEFWYHSPGGEPLKPGKDPSRTPSSSDEDFVLHIDIKEEEPE